jgi:hypothetical protein
MKLPAIPSPGFLAALPESERKHLGRAGITAAEALATWQRGEEKKLQQLCAEWLSLNEIYFETDRMDKKTSGKRGRADFRICVQGLWLSAECKAQSEKLAHDQKEQAARLLKSGGRFVLIYSLQDLIQHIRRLEKVAQGVVKDSFDYRLSL